MTNIDWTKPIETDEENPLPVRVLCTDQDGRHPVAAAIKGCFVHQWTLEGGPHNTLFPKLRNVPERVKGWINIYRNDFDNRNRTGRFMFESLDEAMGNASPDHIACVEIDVPVGHGLEE